MYLILKTKCEISLVEYARHSVHTAYHLSTYDVYKFIIFVEMQTKIQFVVYEYVVGMIANGVMWLMKYWHKDPQKQIIAIIIQYIA